MPAFAPRSAVRARAARVQDAAEAHHLETVLLAGVSYPAEVSLEPLEPMLEQSTGLVELVERGFAKILKRLLPVAPARDAVLSVNGVEYTVEAVGASPNAPAWRIRFSRTAPKS